MAHAIHGQFAKSHKVLQLLYNIIYTIINDLIRCFSKKHDFQGTKSKLGLHFLGAPCTNRISHYIPNCKQFEI